MCFVKRLAGQTASSSINLFVLAVCLILTLPAISQAQGDGGLAQRLGPDLDLALQSGGTVATVLAEAQESVALDAEALDAFFAAAAGKGSALEGLRVYLGRDIVDARDIFLRAVRLLDAALADPRSADPAARAAGIGELASAFQDEMGRLLASLGAQADAPVSGTALTRFERLLALEADFERIIALLLSRFAPAAGDNAQQTAGSPGVLEGEPGFSGGTVIDAFGGPGTGETNGVVVPFEDQESAASPS